MATIVPTPRRVVAHSSVRRRDRRTLSPWSPRRAGWSWRVIALGVVAPRRSWSGRCRRVAATPPRAELARSIARSTDASWSGEVQHARLAQRPARRLATFGGVARLLGDQNHLRVWWRDADTWRVDRLADHRRVRHRPRRRPVGHVELRGEPGPFRAVLPHPAARRQRRGATRTGGTPARRRAQPTSSPGCPRGAWRAAVLRACGWSPPTRARRSRASTSGSTSRSGLPLRVEVYGAKDTTHPALASQMTSVPRRRPRQ